MSMLSVLKLVKSDFKRMRLYDQKSRNVFHSGFMILLTVLYIAQAIVFFAFFQQVIAEIKCAGDTGERKVNSFGFKIN
ncbi:MAG: hypothetical protein ACI9XB_000253 [Gammaproteobacteria bacterium]|jgi:hypothetical protein